MWCVMLVLSSSSLVSWVCFGLQILVSAAGVWGPCSFFCDCEARFLMECHRLWVGCNCRSGNRGTSSDWLLPLIFRLLWLTEYRGAVLGLS